MKWNRKLIIPKLGVLLLIALFAGCEEKIPSSLSPATCKISGNLGEYFEVVEGEYPVSDISNEFKFKVKRIKESEEGLILKFGIGYAIFDEKGKALIVEKAKLEDVNPLMSLSFLGLKPGETGDVTINIKGWPDKLRGAKTFRVSFNCKQELPAWKLISLDDFIDYPYLVLNEENLIAKGFTESLNEETTFPQYSKDGIIIDYNEDFDDDGEGTKYIGIHFSDMDDCFNVVDALRNNDDWTMHHAPLGETFKSKKGNLEIYHEISDLHIRENIKY